MKINEIRNLKNRLEKLKCINISFGNFQEKTAKNILVKILK